jgi:hypothetical protein
MARRSCHIERIDGKNSKGSDTLFFETVELGKHPGDYDAEDYLIAPFMQAMSEGRSIKIHGAGSQKHTVPLQIQTHFVLLYGKGIRYTV